MAANLTALQTIQPLHDSLNTTVITQGNILETVTDAAITTSEGTITILTMIAIFLMIFYNLRRRDGQFQYDSLQAGVFASGFTIMFGIILLALGMASSFVHVTFFAMAFIILIMTTFYVRSRFA